MFSRLILASLLSVGLVFAQGTAQKKSEPGKQTNKAAQKDKAAAGSDAPVASPGYLSGQADTTVDAAGGALDINSATMDELLKLPGIGEAYAQRIINNRPYQNKYQLVQKNIIPGAAYGKIKDKIIARQTKK